MFISKLYVENFRSIKSAEVQLDPMTTFVGKNGVGKSTVLYALESFYNVGSQYSELDYYNHVLTDISIKIRVTYDGLLPDELAEFGSYIQDGRLTVTKVINQGGARYYGTTPQIPSFAELRKLGANDKRTRLRALIEGGEVPGFPEIPRKSEDVDRALLEYEATHPELTIPIERETQFFGPRNVGGGKLDKFTKFVLIPAVRDAASETERRGAVMQLLDLIVSRSISKRQDFKDFKVEFEEKVRVLYGSENLPELSELGRLVTERLRRYSPGAELEIDFAEMQPPVIPLPTAVVTVSDDNFKVPINYSGHGLQRALILALLEQLSLTPNSPSVEGAVDDLAEAAHRMPSLILAIEEPELYLHPARSRYLARILRDIAKKRNDQNWVSTQVLTVTHSPYFVEVEHFDEVRLCRKKLDLDGRPRTTVFTELTRLKASQRLAEITGKNPEDFSEISFVARAAPVLNSIVNEGLFSDVAVVVEGDSDAAVLWEMQKIMHKNWDELGVVVVPVSGKNNIDRAVVAFQGFGIPTYFLFDGDKSKNKSATTNRSLLTLGLEGITDYPDTNVGHHCAAFEEDLEAYLESVVGERYLTLRDECAVQHGHTQPSKALKNSEIMAEFLSTASSEGFRFTVIEDIVERISNIALHLHAQA